MTHGRDNRTFKVFIYEQDYKELCSWVLRHKKIETGGDLFGLWSDDRRAVIQLALGPGKGCRRSGTSFFQDVKYLEEVGVYLTGSEGLCHIGEWHSHHQLGLARPSGGDEITVWNNMPTYGLDRFVIFIANIERSKRSEAVVNIGCFLFEFENRVNGKRQRLPVLPGRFEILPGENPIGKKQEIRNLMEKQAEPPAMVAREREIFRIEDTFHENRNKIGVWKIGEQESIRKRQKGSSEADSENVRKKQDHWSFRKGREGGYPAEERRNLLPNDQDEEPITEQPITNALVSSQPNQSNEGFFGRVCRVFHGFVCPNCWGTHTN